MRRHRKKNIYVCVCVKRYSRICNILTFDRAVNEETGLSDRRYQNITLTCGRVEFGVDATPMGSRWMSNNYITRCHRRLVAVGVRVAVQFQSQLPAEWEPASDRGLGRPNRMRKKCCYSQRNWGQYVAVCFVFNSPLTHNPFASLVRDIFF